ncbi:STAS-like domain-containing protein [Synechococcus sp. HJ21-Hayes]|uniref:STAS-like domain-containing protein n=1 Tax=unclassified Synechococcus TaxID=2626047 RepID=UPI0020CFE576|nr:MULTISPECIES: STAS-like domain-containing protein [unclassified Synechococcus]MCP9831969.1 STAS-like domain-containing protein [Synechococcus sp. JJ3a-Johnson]MCP9853821.1 STAS-like domain-containing protein [Synechococcus sp. HJ21-Hayes]
MASYPFFSVATEEQQFQAVDAICAIALAAECLHTGGRQPAKLLRRKIQGLLPAMDGEPLILDFSGVKSAASSFLDELLGRLAAEDPRGQTIFEGPVRIQGMTPTVQAMARWWWRSGWPKAPQVSRSAEIQYSPSGAAHRPAGHAAAGDLKGHPTRLVHALQESNDVDAFVCSILNGDVSSPLRLELCRQELWLLRHFVAPEATHRRGVGLPRVLEHGLPGGRAEEIPVVSFQLNHLHGSMAC